MAGSVTSIGLNFNELRSIGLEPTALEAQMAAFAERHGLSRLVVHADPWALALTREDPERELDALAMGCLLASARAEAGRPVAKPHAPAAAAFARPPRAPISACAGSGWRIVCCAAPYLRNPASTIGLGDTFTAGTMLVHAGPKRPAVLANLSGLLALSGATRSLGGPSSGLSAANEMRS